MQEAKMTAIVHFEIPFSDVERAKKFYTELFGWKIEKSPGMDCWMIQTQEGAGGGMWERQQPDQIVDYFGISPVLDYSTKVLKLSGKILIPKMAVPKMGYFAVCMGTEGTVFGLWKADSQAE
jgi:predicted enzyme related to lactoylglutathione lyase